MREACGIGRCDCVVAAPYNAAAALIYEPATGRLALPAIEAAMGSGGDVGGGHGQREKPWRGRNFGVQAANCVFITLDWV